MTRFLGVLALASAAAFAQAPLPKIAFAVDLHDLQLSAEAEKTLNDELMEKSFAALRPAFIPITPEETAKALKGLGADFYESNEKLMRLALLTEAHYGLSLSVYVGTLKMRSAPVGVILTSRVVRSDGKQVGEPQTYQRSFSNVRKLSRAVMAGSAFSELLGKAVEDLKRLKLSAVREVETPPVETAPVSAGGAGEPSGLSRPPPPPPLPPVDVKTSTSRALFRPIGLTAIGVGAAAVVAGVITFALAPRITSDPLGNVAPADVGKLHGTYAQQSAGVGLMVGGVAAAAAGGVMLLLPSDPGSTVKVSWMPISGGMGLLVRGNF